MSAMMAKAVVKSPAEPNPCKARNRMSCTALCASPHKSEPSRKMLMAVISTGLRP
ncbi:hypothetical protein Mterra_03302 [Calidithermus terrae]|uniref:Uncharacterized protein n=1 Tax=Calidithermus terrae TaxID=1408545 RepID=A0A399EBB8_9DEIN|nr:hypothetical protein Mterra_03302 [Calidithermus terrae]